MADVFKVRRKRCPTCIYNPDCPLDLAALERAVTDSFGSITGWRVCHHTEDACCRGFWDLYKNDFTMGRMAQMFGWVEFTDEDIL